MPLIQRFLFEFSTAHVSKENESGTGLKRESYIVLTWRQRAPRGAGKLAENLALSRTRGDSNCNELQVTSQKKRMRQMIDQMFII